MALGDEDEAFRRLEQASEDKAVWRGAIRVDPRFLPLRDDARFVDLLERMGF